MTPHQEPTQAQKRRLKTLDYIRGYFAEHRYGPTMAEIKSAMNISSFAVVAYQLDRLEEQGYLTRQPDRARGIILKDSWGQSLQPLPVVPVIGALRCDQPLLRPQPEPAESGPKTDTVRVPGKLYFQHRLLYALGLTGADWPEALLTPVDIIVCSHPAPGQSLPDGSCLLAWDSRSKQVALGALTRHDDHWQLQPPHPDAAVKLLPPLTPPNYCLATLVLRNPLD